MNRLQKKILTIALGIGNISLCLTAASVATYAWFLANNPYEVNVASDDVTIGAAQPDEKMTYKFYKYDDNLKAGKGFTNTSDFVLPDYDTYFTEKNIYANIILRAEVATPATDTDDYEFSIDITRLASDFMTNNKIGKVTSNIIQIKSTVYAFKEVGETDYTVNTASLNSIDESDLTDDATIYETARSYFASRNTPTTFVPIRYLDDGSAVVNRNNGGEDCTISLIPDLPAGFEINQVIMYLEFSYHPTLVSEYVRTNSSEGASKYSLSGDISKIIFTKRAKAAKTSLATGKYIKVESNNNLVNGQFLHAKETNEGTGAGKILKGSLATSNKSASTASGIYVDDNAADVSINSLPANEPKSIDSTDAIDNESFEFGKTNKTFKSKNGYYIGNNTASTAGIATNDNYAAGYSHEIKFEGSHSSINAYGNSGAHNMRLRYNSSGNKFYYYNKTGDGVGEQTDLFRYTENVAETPTLSSIAITTSSSKTNFYVGQKFSIPSLVVTATYTNGSTADVTGSCTFTSDTTPTSLVPEGRTGATTLSSTATNKTVYVNYTEGGVTIADVARPSYKINVLKDDLSSIAVTTYPNRYYYAGESFSSSGMKVKATFLSGREETDITPTSVSTYNDMLAGNKTVTVSYTVDGVTKTTTFIIYVYAKALTINKSSISIAEGASDTVTITHNQNVTYTVDPGETSGTVTINKASPIAYTGSTKATMNTVVTITGGNPGTVTITFSSPNVADVTCTVTITETPADSFTIGCDEIVSNSGYSVYTKSVSKEYTTGSTTSKNWIVTYGGNNYSVGTNSSNRTNCTLANYSKYAVSPVSTSDIATAFASQSSLNKIKNISFTHTTGSNNTRADVYVLYSADGNTFSQPTLASGSASQGMRMSAANTEYTFIFNQALTGYFALVFKDSGSGGNFRIDYLSVTYNKKILDSIEIGGDCSTKTYNDGASLNTAGLTVIASYTDGSTANVTASATLTPATNPLTVGTTSVVVNASYTEGGVNKVASKTITGITVNAILVTSITLNKSSTTIGIGGTEQLSVASILPANATDKTVTWSVYSGANYVSVSSTGLVTANAAGEAVVRATANDGSGVYGACTVTVTTAPSTYTVTYTANGGTGSDYTVSNITAGSTHNLVAVATAGFTAPSGKQFKCWSVSGTERAVGYSLTVNSNITVSAVWENIPSGYVISYNGNGNTGGTAVSANAAGNYVLKSNTWTRTGCTFAGWAVDTGSGYTKMAAGATVTGVTSNITVKAIWNSTLTITRSSFSTSGGYAWYDWSQSTASGTPISGKGHLYTTEKASMQFNKSKGAAAVFNTTALPGRIIQIQAQTASGTNRAWNAYVTSTACSLSGSSLTFGSNKTTVGSAVTITTSLTSLGTPTAGYTYFCLQENVSNASYLSKIVVTYEIW